MTKMKRKSIISMLLLSMMLGMFSTSCQDMLSPDSERHSYTVAQDTLYSYWGILKSLQNIAERYVILNECRGDLVDETSFVSDTIGAIVNFGEVRNPENWKDGACVYLKISDYYHIINSCNAYIANCDTTLKTGTDKSYMIKEYAQVHAIRAWVYMQLLYAYGENRVPFFKEPMVTTDDIYNFIEDKNHPLVTHELLAKELAPDLERLEAVELDPSQGLPNYNTYSGACHSSKCMFPVPLVLGDLYLLGAADKDDKESFRKAAQHYYNYINTKKCGPLVVDRFYCTGLLDDRQDYPIYDNFGNPFSETGAVSETTEAITCIPSNTGKLDGRVLTDVNRLFGFEAELQTASNAAEVTVGDKKYQVDINYVILRNKYERELIPSKGYETLCDDQKYEIYEGTTSASGVFDWANCQLVELRSDERVVGDARRTWIYDILGEQWIFRAGDDILYGKMVSKQNPYGGFSTTYPVIYRKSTVWLRYAEALNRAGFPGYAFAILKTGLCDNNSWFPEAPYIPTNFTGFSYFNEDGTVKQVCDYPVKDGEAVFAYYDAQNDEILPYRTTSLEALLEKASTENLSPTYEDLETWLNTYFQQEFDDYNAENPDNMMEAPRTIDKTKVYWAPLHGEKSFASKPSADCKKACYYIPLAERQDALATGSAFLDFKGHPYLKGHSQTQLIYTKEQGQLLRATRSSLRYPSSIKEEDSYTIGVHQRGCGFICYDLDIDENTRSSYNYVAMVGKKLKDYGITVADADLEDYVYDEANKENVQKAVEDLIIDEMGLELAFEGTRFSDLCRVSLRRNDNDYLAKRVAKRHTGEIDAALRTKLQDRNNWWLPVPED